MEKCKHQFVGVLTVEGFMWCNVCDKWIKIIKETPTPRKEN